MNHDRITLFGIPIDNLSMADSLDYIESLIRTGTPHQHVVVNVDKLVKMQQDPALRDAVLSCDMINCEGQPIVWASRLFGRPLKARVTGVDLFPALVARCAEHGFRPFLLGARAEVVDRVAALLQAQHPRLQLAGWRNGYWSPDEEAGVVAQIKQAHPDVLFMATPSPMKEIFLSRWKQELQIPFSMGVGGAFDVLAGRVKRAPRWLQRCGLEWLYRLVQEPRRLWRRYLVDDLAFVGLLVREWRTARRK